MPGELTFQLSPAVLEWARNSMGYTIEEAAKKAGVPNERFEAWETGRKRPTYKQLETLAERVYKRPLALLLLPQPPKEDSIQKDFRNLSNAEISHLSPEVRLALRRAKRYQLILDEVSSSEDPPAFTKFKVSLSDKPTAAAKRFREFIGLSLKEQKQWSYEEAFNNFRRLLEDIGIYIFLIKMPMEEARAFCLSGKYPIIVLNSEDARNGRIFSLFHELCHIFFNANGIFRDGETGRLTKEYAEIERFCNQFAASFLVPDESFAEDLKNVNTSFDVWTDSTIGRLAKEYNVSNEVIARKLLALNLISQHTFWSIKRRWDAIAKSAKEKEREKRKEQASKGIAQDIKLISEKGKPYVSNVVSAYERGLISSSDLSNYLEVKLDHLPKIIQRLNS